jgi:ribonuclease P protein component
MDFNSIRTHGRRYHCGGFVFWILKRSAVAEGDFPEEAGPRVGFVASRSAIGNAVQRNRAKRRLREVFRQNQNLVPPGVDLIFVGRRSLNGLEYAQIERDFLKICAQLFPILSAK